MTCRIDSRHNSQWIARVTVILRNGYGAEDIAVKLGCSVESVREEVRIRRNEGTIAALVKPKYGKTAKSLMTKNDQPPAG